MTSLRIRFQNESYWLIGDLEEGGAIAPLWHCDENGDVVCLDDSFAHLFPNGLIMRYHEVIGTREDILLDSIDVEWDSRE